VRQADPIHSNLPADARDRIGRGDGRPASFFRGAGSGGASADRNPPNQDRQPLKEMLKQNAGRTAFRVSSLVHLYMGMFGERQAAADAAQLTT
jgi:hypothetical protein